MESTVSKMGYCKVCKKTVKFICFGKEGLVGYGERFDQLLVCENGHCQYVTDKGVLPAC